MKFGFLALGILLPLASQAYAADINASDALTGALIATLGNTGPGYGDMEQGTIGYGAEFECVNSTSKCFIRALSGFSVQPSAPIQLPGNVSQLILQQLGSIQDFQTLINTPDANIPVTNGSLLCYDNSKADTVTPNTCAFRASRR